MARERSEKKFERPVDEFEKKVVDVNRITKVVKGGRKMRFSALVVVGDKKGRVGMGMGKGAEVPMASEKATQAAKRDLKIISIINGTIPHEVIGKYEKTKIIMQPAKEGNGIIAGGPVRDVVELVGIKNITCKMYGSNNPVNCVKATMNGLLSLKTAEEIAQLRGKKVEEIL